MSTNTTRISLQYLLQLVSDYNAASDDTTVLVSTASDSQCIVIVVVYSGLDTGTLISEYNCFTTLQEAIFYMENELV